MPTKSTFAHAILLVREFLQTYLYVCLCQETVWDQLTFYFARSQIFSVIFVSVVTFNAISLKLLINHFTYAPIRL